MIDIAQALAGNILLRGLPPPALAELAGHSRTLTYAAGALIFQKGDAGDGMMAVLSGRVRIRSFSSNGKELVLNIISPGELFGEVALLDDGPRTADAVAIESCRLAALDRSVFLPFLERHPPLALSLLRLLTERFRRTSAQLEETVFLELPSRLANRICWLADVCGEPAMDGIRIGLKLSQEQLGALVGMTRESINKQLKIWRDAGIVGWVDGHIIVHDREALTEIGRDG